VGTKICRETRDRQGACSAAELAVTQAWAARRVNGSERGVQVRRWKRTSRRRAVALAVGLVAGLVGGANDATAQPAPTDRFVVSLNAGWRPASRTFASTSVFTVFSEEGSFQADYPIDGGGIVDGGVSARLWRNLAVGLDVSSYRSVNPALITSVLPHPFFFDLARTTTGVAAGLERQELGVHVRALWVMQLADWLVVSVSGGPSLIHAQQDIVSSVEHTESQFPFDEVIFSGQTVSHNSANNLGLNSGIDIDAFVLHKLPFLNRYEVMEHIGVGLLIRYVRGSVNLEVGDGLVEVDLGGLQLTTGVRFRF